jgi:hypothetical protein
MIRNQGLPVLQPIGSIIINIKLVTLWKTINIITVLVLLLNQGLAEVQEQSGLYKRIVALL